MPVYRWLRASRLWPILSLDPRVQAVSLGDWARPNRPPSPKRRNKIVWAPDDREPVQLYPRLDEREWQ
ncbi:Type I Iterative PKS [Pestalotiopsis sp. IQ-011]